MKTKRADEYMIENNFDSVDFISIDVEGHELAVLRGFGDFLHNAKIVQFEYGGTTYSAGVKMNELLTHLKDYGFCGFSYLSMIQQHRLVPMNWTDETEDHYAYCNVVCVNKKHLKDFEHILEWPI